MPDQPNIQLTDQPAVPTATAPSAANPVGLPPKKSSKGKWIAIVLIIAMIMAISGGAFYYLYMADDSNSTSNTTPTPTASVTPTPDPAIVGWKSYSDTRYGFVFNYPAKMEVNADCGIYAPLDDMESKKKACIYDASTTLANSDAPFDGLVVYVDENPENISLSEYIDNATELYRQANEANTGEDMTGEPTITDIDSPYGPAKLVDYPWGADNIQYVFMEHDTEAHGPIFVVLAVSEAEAGSFTEIEKIVATVTTTEE